MAVSSPNALLEPELLERIKGLALVARRVVEGGLHGMHQAPLHGLSVEFAQHRAYTPGDEIKHLDWRVLGRSDRYVVKQYQQETNLRAVLFVDCSRSMAFGGSRASGGQPQAGAGANQGPGEGPADGRSKFHYARRLAAALSYLMLHQGDSVGLVLTSDRIVGQVSPQATPGQITSLCRALERARPGGETNVSGVLSQLAPRLKRRSLVIVIGDLLDDPLRVLSALGQLGSRGHELLVFQVLDPREIEFDLGLAGYGMTVIRDMETGAEFDAEPALIRDLVRAEIQRFFERLDAGARRHGIPLLRCATDDPIERVLTEYLHTRLRQRGVRRTSPAASRRAAGSRPRE